MASDDGGASAAVGLYEPEGMNAVREKYAELGGMVGTFSEKVGDVLSRAEVQFLQAYRGHMQEVHRERLELEAQLKAAEAQQASDTQIRALERDREWYLQQRTLLEAQVDQKEKTRKKMAHLAAFPLAQAAAMHKDLLYLQEQHDNLSKDRDRLARQLKAVRKHQRLAAVTEQDDRRGREAAAAAAQAAAQDGRGLNASRSESRGPATPQSSGGFGHTSPRAGSAVPHGMLASRSSHWRTHRSAGGSRGVGGGEGRLHRTDDDGEGFGGRSVGGPEAEKLRQAIEAEKKRQAADRAELLRLRSLAVADRLLKTELEEFFLQATEDLRKEMGRQHRTGTKNALASTRSKSGSKDSRNPAFDDGPALEASLAALYDALFPSTA